MTYLPVLLLSALAGLVSSLLSTDGQLSQQPHCGTFVAPDALFLLKEAQPDVVLPITDNIFRLDQRIGSNGGAYCFASSTT